MDQTTGATERPLLSLTMIVKNEEEHLARCLESVRGIADELIVVDTGSRDRTVEIARAHGARVEHFAWCDDFAAARNVALQHATGVWCLHLDADEVVVEREPGALRRELLSQPETRVFMRVPVKSLMSAGLGHTVYGANRLYRNLSNVTWIRPIHENVVYVGQPAADFEGGSATIRVEHDGYADPTPERAIARNRRNTRILRRALKVTPDDPGLYYYLAIETILAGKFAASLRWAREGIRRAEDQVRPDFVGALYCQAMKAANAMGKPKLAVKIGLAGARHYAFSELCYLLAGNYMNLNDYVNAQKYYELAMVLRNRFSEYQMEVGTGSWKALLGLAAIAWEQGNMELALERVRRCREWAPDEGMTNFMLGKTLVGFGQAAEAAMYLRRAIQITPALYEAYLRLAQAHMMLEEPQAAYDLLDDQRRAHPEVYFYAQWLGDLLFEMGEHQECVNVLGAAIERHTGVAAIYERLGQALRHLGRYQDALNAFALASAIDPTSASARVGLSFAAQMVEWDLTRSRATPGPVREPVAALS